MDATTVDGIGERAAHTQNLFVMRHGERLDAADPTWIPTAARPWDPPLTETGKLQALAVGQKFRSEGVVITRILVSPFLRCVQTAAEVIKGMSSVDSGGIVTSRVKISIEYGLAELMNGYAIPNPPRNVMDTPDIPWILPLEELYAILPSGVLDTSVQPTLPKVPEWGETFETGHHRFSSTFFAVADKFPGENVLCVTHGEAVLVSVLYFRPDDVANSVLYNVQYCAFTQAQREVFSTTPLKAGPWKPLTKPDLASGFLRLPTVTN